MSTSIGLSWDGWIFRWTHFTRPSGLEANDSSKLPVVQALYNSMKIFLNKSKHYIILFH